MHIHNSSVFDKIKQAFDILFSIRTPQRADCRLFKRYEDQSIQ